MKFCYSIAVFFGLLFTACDRAKMQLAVGESAAESEAEMPVSEVEEEIPGKNDDTVPPSHVVKTLKEWIPEFHRVDAMVYDFTASENLWLVSDGKLNPGVVKSFTKTLSKAEVERLESFVTGSPNGDPLRSRCYSPHHGFVFYDKQNKILGHLEICLMCKTHKYAPDASEEGKGKLPEIWNLKGIEDLLKEKGFPVLDSDEKWRAFFEEQKKK